jgi:putative protein-disulfide isomerase
MEAISSAFYGHNKDVTQGDVLAGIAEEAGYNRPAFEAVLLSPDMRNETFRHFLTAQELGVRGFPTLIVGGGAEGYTLVTNGYRPLDGIIEALEKWLAERPPVRRSRQYTGARSTCSHT